MSPLPDMRIVTPGLTPRTNSLCQRRELHPQHHSLGWVMSGSNRTINTEEKCLRIPKLTPPPTHPTNTTHSELLHTVPWSSTLQTLEIIICMTETQGMCWKRMASLLGWSQRVSYATVFISLSLLLSTWQSAHPFLFVRCFQKTAVPKCPLLWHFPLPSFSRSSWEFEAQGQTTEIIGCFSKRSQRGKSGPSALLI